MGSRKGMKLSCIIMGGSIFLTGCGAGAAPASNAPRSSISMETPTGTPSVPEIPSTASTATASHEESILISDTRLSSLNDTWATQDGYKYSLRLVKQIPAIKEDVANAKPGKVNIPFVQTLTAEITNLTPNRNAPRPMVSISPAWKKEGVVCQALKLQGSDVTVFESATGGGDYCILGGARGFTDFEESIPRQGTALMPVDFKDALVFNEADAELAKQALLAPDLWFLTRPATDTNTTTCSLAGESVSVATGPIPCLPAS